MVARRIAFELQHTLIALEDIERRANSYAKSGIAQMWIPFMGSSIWQKGKLLKTGEWFVAEYSARPFERWIHGFNQGEGMWMYDPKKKMFWLGKMEGHQKYVSETTYYTEGGDENYGGGYYRYSKRYKELKLNGPFNAQSLKVELKTRKAFSRGGLNWPAGRLARFVVTEQKSEELMLTSSDSQPAPAPHG